MFKDIENLDENDFTRLPVAERQKHYGEFVECLIRKKYSLSEELAILRQRDTKPEEYTAYNDYAEQCKAEAKTLLNIV